MIRQDANKVDNELRFISLKVEQRAHTGRCRARELYGQYLQERFTNMLYY
jgi:hypothetical protein